MSSRSSLHLTPEQYLAQHHLLVYIEDAVAQLLIHKEDNPKVEPAKFFSDYFSSLRDGSHTLLRDFSFIMATPRNRACFIKTFYRCFGAIGKKGDLLRTKEYHALASLICNNIPYDIVQRAERIILIDDATDCLISFSDFLFAFQAQMYFHEFIEKSYEVYQLLIQQSHRSPRDAVVVVPSTMEAASPSSGAMSSAVRHAIHGHAASDSVEAAAFLKSLLVLADKATYSVPPVEAIQDVLDATNRVTFYEFLVGISKNDKVNSAIGALPTLGELYKDIESYDNATVMPPSLSDTTAGATQLHQQATSGDAAKMAGVSALGAAHHRPSSGGKVGTAMTMKKTVVARKPAARRHRGKGASDDDDDSDDSKTDSDDSSGA